jgi:hypothetical protein
MQIIPEGSKILQFIFRAPSNGPPESIDTPASCCTIVLSQRTIAVGAMAISKERVTGSILAQVLLDAAEGKNYFLFDRRMLRVVLGTL